jgi:hypothetical protein
MPKMSNEETLSSNVTCVEDNKVVLMHINIKQEPHVEEEYQVCMSMMKSLCVLIVQISVL